MLLRSSTLSFLALCASCIADVEVTASAQVLCANDDECPQGALCVVDIGRCVDEDSPCIVDGNAIAGNGTDCGDGLRCIDGGCREPFCGDGIVDDDKGEECDPREDALCRETCVRARCG